MKTRPRIRDCDCPHGFPLCACHEDLAGAALLRRSRYLSSLAGWPSPKIDQAYINAHNERVREARAEQAEAEAAPQRPATKPRVPLGFPQRQLPPPDCGPCHEVNP